MVQLINVCNGMVLVWCCVLLSRREERCVDGFSSANNVTTNTTLWESDIIDSPYQYDMVWYQLKIGSTHSIYTFFGIVSRSIIYCS